MDGLSFAASVIGHLLSWPVLVLLFVLIFKQPLTELIGRVKSYEGLGQKLTFGDELAKTEENVDNAVEGVRDTVIGPHAIEPSLDGPWAQLAKEADTNPTYALVTAWERLTGALDEVIIALAPEATEPGRDRRRRTQIAWLHDLAKKGLVPSDYVAAASELRALRNRVAHGQHNPSPGEAVVFIEAAQDLSEAADILAQRGPGKSPEPEAD